MLFEKQIEEVRSLGTNLKESIRKYLFGPNNERLDFIMDSFASYDVAQQRWVLLGGLSFLAVTVLIVFGIYFSQLNSLDRDLDRAFSALHELRKKKTEFDKAKSEYDGLLKLLSTSTQNFRIKPFFEEKSKKIGVTLQGLQDQVESLPAENILSRDLKYVRADMRLPNTSIPRLLNFLTEVEKSKKFVSIQDLQIRGRYGTKLYFDMSTRFRGYALK